MLYSMGISERELQEMKASLQALAKFDESPVGKADDQKLQKIKLG